MVLEADPIVPDPHMSMQALAELASGRPENSRGAMDDDCETLGNWQIMAVTSLRQALRGGGDLKGLCAGFECLFCEWKAKDWAGMEGFVREMAGLLESGALSIATVTGIATNAAAGDVGGDSYNGHCHNVGRVDVEGSPLQCFIVEGTAPMEIYTVTKDSPTVRCKVMNEQMQYVDKELCRTDFLTRFGKTVAVLTQFVNKVHGAQGAGAGWPRQEEMTGWVSSTIYTNGLDSDPSFPLSFYNRFMYTGLRCTEGGLGCLPVQEAHVGRTAGCHPYELNRLDLRAVNVALPPDVHEKMLAILDEANPPTSQPEFFQMLAATWVPARPLSEMNRDAQAELAPGVRYTVVSCMESPGSQDYIPILHEVKRRLAERANAINAAAPSSDGIHLRAEMLGTGVSLKMFVPDRPIHELTVIKSMIQGMADVGWQGPIPQAGG